MPVDVVIVGAGLSGLVSALHLLDLGVQATAIIVLEGRKRVGGRLFAHEGTKVAGAWHITVAPRVYSLG